MTKNIFKVAVIAFSLAGFVSSSCAATGWWDADPWKDPDEYDPNAQIAILVYGAGMSKKPEVAKRFMTAYIKSLRD